MFEIFQKLAWFFRLRWKTTLLAISGLVACAILSATIPLLVGRVIDQMTQGTLTSSLLTQEVLLLLGIGILMYALRNMWRTLLFGNSTRLEYLLRKRLFNHFTKMDQAFYNNHRTGDLMAHATNDLAAIRFVAGGGILTLTDSLSITLATLFSMFVLIDWKLSLYTILPFPFLVLIARYLGKQINRTFKGALESFSKMNDHVQESIAGINVIKAFGEEADDYQDFVATTDNVVKKNERVYRIDAAYGPAIDFVTGLTYVLTIFFGSYFVKEGRISLGQLIAYFSYLTNMTWPLIAVGHMVNTLERGNVSYDRITNLLSNKALVVNDPNPVTGLNYQDLKVNIQSFTYPEADQATLKDIHFHLEDGDILGLVGKTGSGKSTLFSLLVRNFDIDQGSIQIDGIDLARIDVTELNEHVGYISQDNLLFSTTVRDNIRFGNPHMSQDEVEYFAKLANVHEDILTFDQGYDTLVGERGVSLSGGQKQRVSIARTLAMNPKILIMDDALSAVDAKTEQTILANLKDHRRSGITLIGTHRLSSVIQAKETLVLQEGRVIERGNHEELLAQKGWYQNMFQQQELEQSLEGDEAND